MSRQARIRGAFDKAHAYDSHAHAQAASARRLAALTRQHGVKSGARILDMGCGTGRLAVELLEWTGASSYLCADISPAMLSRASHKLAYAIPHPRFAAMDASFPALKGGFDLIVSNMALHWTPDLTASIATLWALLAPGGMLAAAIPGRETFNAWRQAHERLGLSCGLQDFPDARTFASAFPVAPAMHEERHVLRLSGALDLPRHLKAVGGFVPRAGHAPLTPAQFKAVLAEIDRERPAMGYHVLFALALKPA
jgi:malonyl-CoA O-methyltransferase